MGTEIQLFSDDNGLAVIGEPQAVEKFLHAEGLWNASKGLDLHRVLGIAADITQMASEIAANGGRWIKLTPESARLVKEHGLTDSKTPGIKHVMIGKPGRVKNWLQTEQGPAGSLLTNPAALSSVAGLMAQVAKQQTEAEIIRYLEAIDEKVDDVLAKVDDTVVKDMKAARLQIQRAQTMRELEGRVTNDTWSEAQDVPGKIAGVQSYALLQLETIAEKLERKKRVGKLADAAEKAGPDVQKWLAVLADCFRLQESFDVIVLDRAMDDPPAAQDAKRLGLEADRWNRLAEIANHTEALLARMEEAVGKANARMVWSRTKSHTVIHSGNDVARGVDEFHALLGIDEGTHSWEPRQLGRAENIGSLVIQKSKDTAPVVGSLIGVAATVILARGDGSSSGTGA